MFGISLHRRIPDACIHGGISDDVERSVRVFAAGEQTAQYKQLLVTKTKPPGQFVNGGRRTLPGSAD